jgi:hypothetical protein
VRSELLLLPGSAPVGIVFACFGLYVEAQLVTFRGSCVGYRLPQTLLDPMSFLPRAVEPLL